MAAAQCCIELDRSNFENQSSFSLGVFHEDSMKVEPGDYCEDLRIFCKVTCLQMLYNPTEKVCTVSLLLTDTFKVHNIYITENGYRSYEVDTTQLTYLGKTNQQLTIPISLKKGDDSFVTLLIDGLSPFHISLYSLNEESTEIKIPEVEYLDVHFAIFGNKEILSRKMLKAEIEKSFKILGQDRKTIYDTYYYELSYLNEDIEITLKSNESHLTQNFCDLLLSNPKTDRFTLKNMIIFKNGKYYKIQDHTFYITEK